MSSDRNDQTTVQRVDPLVGAVLDGRYRIEFSLASGGFGAIYRGRHLPSGHEVAIKVMHARFTADPGVIKRFRREGETLTALRCPHTIAAYEIGETDDGMLYIVMELLHGVTLFERFRLHGKLPWRRMGAIARAVCESLAEAHALGVVHRDLKPTNIHLEKVDDDEDYVKVLDFGIAKILQDSAFDRTDVTLAGQMIGTLDYMSPEQMLGGVVTGKTDIYTLAIVMYEMITARRPFAEATSASTALAALMKPPPPLSAIVPVPTELDEIVLRCLDRDADVRYDALGLVAALEKVAAPRPRATSFNEDPTVVIRRAISGQMFAQSEVTTIAPVPPPPPRALPGVAPIPATRSSPPPPGVAPASRSSPPPGIAPMPVAPPRVPTPHAALPAAPAPLRAPTPHAATPAVAVPRTRTRPPTPAPATPTLPPARPLDTPTVALARPLDTPTVALPARRRPPTPAPATPLVPAPPVLPDPLSSTLKGMTAVRASRTPPADPGDAISAAAERRDATIRFGVGVIVVLVLVAIVAAVATHL